MDAISPKYDQEFFLRLARPADGSLAARREARRRWREWRRDPANAGVKVTFEGVDFRTDENRCISFSALEFGDGANFRTARFGEKARFARARFGERADFTDATFGARAKFNSATFGNWAKFNSATFGNVAEFNSATFGNWAQFNCATFGDGAKFNNATFGNWAQFESATFRDWAQFESATFGDRAHFNSATFGDRAHFNSATFGDRAHFNSATFGDVAEFNSATFGDGAHFNSATFGDWARFNSAAFGNWAHFNSATFGFRASFRAALLQGSTNFSGQSINSWIEEERERLGGARAQGTDDEKVARVAAFLKRQKIEGFGPHRFLNLDFADALILGEINFARRDFQGSAYFTGAQFHQPPDFDGATNLQRIDFTGARVGFAPPDQPLFKPHLTEDSTVPLRLRAFRVVAEQTKNHDLERDLYIEERKAERGVYLARYWRGQEWAKLATHALWIAVMGGYWALSDYGRSLIRPLVWLAISLPLFIGLFIVDLHDQRSKTAQAAADFSMRAGLGFAAPARADGDANDAWRAAKAKHLAATRQLALANTIPFVGPLSIDGDVKKFLLCGVAPDDAESLKKCVPVAPLAYQGVLIGQNVLSALLLFFFGLAMRNYFKVK